MKDVYLILFFTFIIVLNLVKFFYKRSRGIIILPFYWIIFEYIILLTALFFILRAFEISPQHIGLSGFDSHLELAWKCVVSVSIVLVLDYCSLRMLVKQRKFFNTLSQPDATHFSRRIVFADSTYLNSFFIILFCIASGAWEELVFRGMLFYLLVSSGFSIVFIIFITSLLFGLYHFGTGTSQVIYSFFFGILFSLIYVLTDSLIAVILAHISGNLFVLLITIPRLSKEPEEIKFF